MSDVLYWKFQDANKRLIAAEAAQDWINRLVDALGEEEKDAWHNWKDSMNQEMAKEHEDGI